MKFLILNKEAQTIFNNRKTLLEQLVATEEALNEAVTVSVSVVPIDSAEGTYNIVFEDANGDKLATNTFVLPAGKDGENGVDGVGISDISTLSNAQSGMYTLTTIKVTKTDGTTQNFTVYALNGVDGVNGVDGASIEEIDSESDEQQNGYTVTPVSVKMSDGTTLNFEIRAKNGVDGADGPRGLTGNGIASMVSGASYISGDKTITPVTVTYSDGTTQDFSVVAQNGGSTGGLKLYKHNVSFNATETDTTYSVTLCLLNTDSLPIQNPTDLSYSIRSSIKYGVAYYGSQIVMSYGVLNNASTLRLYSDNGSQLTRVSLTQSKITNVEDTVEEYE